LLRTLHPSVYRRGLRSVVVYRSDGRQHKETQARAGRDGPTLHAYALAWVERYRGSGHDSVREQTREEYRRLLSTFALRYFDRDRRLADVDRRALQGFVTWLTDSPSRGRLSDSSIINALTPLRVCLDAAEAEHLVAENPARSLTVPRRRGGRRWASSESHFLTRTQLAGLLLDEIPDEHAALFDLVASTGLRISEAIALRWCDLDLDRDPPRLRVHRAIVNGVVSAPKSRHGARTVPLADDLASRLRACRRSDSADDDLVFPSLSGCPLNPNNLRNRVLRPAAERAGLHGVGLHTLRHTCASLLIEKGASPIRLQRWMGHHSAAYTLEAYGHLIDGELGSPLDLDVELDPRT
jgi:integrase